jgi:diguanylate cyclase (GGDEF)-like protein
VCAHVGGIQRPMRARAYRLRASADSGSCRRRCRGAERACSRPVVCSLSVKRASPIAEKNDVYTAFALEARTSKSLAVRSAALIYIGAGVLSLVESVIPGGPAIAPCTGVAAILCGLLIPAIGERMPLAALAALAALGPLGAAMIAFALATSDGPGDGAILYVWPVLWESFFFGRRGAIGIVVWVAIVHGSALLSMPPHLAYWDRWLDVVATVAVAATVVEVLAARNRRLVAQLALEARLDNLTDLLNRRGFSERAELELARARRERSWVSLVSFDLDHFKVVNDEWGHDIGDRVLVATARVSEAELREVDRLARTGGEEFVVLVPGGKAAEAEALAERLRRSLANARHPRCRRSRPAPASPRLSRLPTSSPS